MHSGKALQFTGHVAAPYHLLTLPTYHTAAQGQHSAAVRPR